MCEVSDDTSDPSEDSSEDPTDDVSQGEGCAAAVEQEDIEDDVLRRENRKEKSARERSSFSYIAYHELCDIQCVPIAEHQPRSQTRASSGNMHMPRYSACSSV